LIIFDDLGKSGTAKFNAVTIFGFYTGIPLSWKHKTFKRNDGIQLGKLSVKHHRLDGFLFQTFKPN